MRSMKRKNPKPKSTAPPPADLLVCFPARARLTLLPKPVCSPARAPAEPHRRHHKKQPAQASPLLWGKEMSSEPTSPKVTCAGQIKIRPRISGRNGGSTKNWQSVMEEIELIHDKKKNPFGFKKEIVNFLSCLRGFRLDFRCFRGFPQSEITTESESEEEESEPEYEPEPDEGSRRTVFSKWFMVLQEEEEEERKVENDVVEDCSVPPPNALLLMRCRSAPSNGWIQRKPKKEEEEEEEIESKISLKLLMEEEKKENLVVMNYDADFYKLSSDIAKETWVVTGSNRSNDDPLLRSRSWKR